jgi:hypothetical protein
MMILQRRALWHKGDLGMQLLHCGSAMREEVMFHEMK